MLLSLHISPLPRTPNALLLRSSESGLWGVVSISILVRRGTTHLHNACASVSCTRMYATAHGALNLDAISGPV
jgi:hypothetical protein